VVDPDRGQPRRTGEVDERDLSSVRTRRWCHHSHTSSLDAVHPLRTSWQYYRQSCHDEDNAVTTTEDREYLPATSRHLPAAFYDTFSRLLGARDA